MTVWKLLLLLSGLLQSSTNGTNSPDAVRDDSIAVKTETLPLTELRQRVANGEFVPIPEGLLSNLISRSNPSDGLADGGRRTQIREARYFARLQGTRLEAGTLDLDLYSDSTVQKTGPLLIGTTSLQELKLSDKQGQVAFGSDASRRLFVLQPGIPEHLSGTWTAEGLVAGDVVTFRLDLPSATVSRLELETPLLMQITSAGSLVQEQKAEGGIARWTLIPGDASRLTFSCRMPPDLNIQGPLSLTSFSSSHVVAADVLSSRWTLGLPASLNQATVLSVRIPENVRISDVMLEDRRPVEWTVANENLQQLVRIVIPATSPGASLTLIGASVLPVTEAWNLPMMSPGQWQSTDGQHRGVVVTPVSQMTVLLPASVELDEWILVGIQERDVVSRPDQSREYQLTQFLPEASAVLRTSTSQARVNDAIVTMVEPAGRLATVRCLINVSCEGSSVIELKWPVTRGWQVIAARYASNQRALFFEFPDETSDAASVPLTVHLPEALEPGASRLFEIQLQQTDNSDTQELSLPLLSEPGTDRTSSIVVFPPAFSLNSDLQRRWGTGRRMLDIDNVRKLAPWFPESRSLSGMQAFEAGDSVGVSSAALQSTYASGNSTVQLEHAVRIIDGLIVENSRVMCPADYPHENGLRFLVSSDTGIDLRWTVDGEPVAARREDAAQSDPLWRYWTVPSGSLRAGMAAVVRCEARRPVVPDFMAAVPFPQTPFAVQGTLQLFSSEEGLLSTDQLEPGPDRPENLSTVWSLPANAVPVKIQVDQNPRIQSGQTIEIHMLHLIGEQDGRLQRDVLAVANVSRNSEMKTLPLSLPSSSQPLVMVNGHRVHLQETASGLVIPLPPSSTDCQVLITWTEPGGKPDQVTGVRQLPRLFLTDLSVPQCTHHLLVDPGLELQTPINLFAARETTEIARVLERLLASVKSKDETGSSAQTRSIPTEVRRFVVRWQLATVQGWQPQTLIDSVTADEAVFIEVTQIRRRLAITAGSFLLLVGGCIGWRHFLSRHRVMAALLVGAILVADLLPCSQIVKAILLGSFRGLATGLFVVMISRWRWLLAIVRNPFIHAGSIFMICVLWTSTVSAVAQDSAASAATTTKSAAGLQIKADVILPDPPIPGSDLVYVRRQLLDLWRQRRALETQQSPTAVVTSLHSRIVADSIDSIEINLTLSVATVSGPDEATLRVPLQSSRLVDCRVDGIKVLPEPDGPDAVRVRVPASTLVSVKAISDNPEAPGLENVSSDAGPLGAFALHKVECRLRPLTSRQASGVQMRLPGLPCPANTVEVVCSPGIFGSARAQTAEGIVSWNPSEGVIPLKSLSMSDGIDLRLFQSGIEKGSPQLATVRILAISETASGQQMLTCVSRFSRWNLLTPEVRYRVPEGYRLVSVSAITGADVVTDLLWSVKDQNALVQLPAGVRDSFVLSLQLMNTTPGSVQSQPIPVAELQQFPDCVTAPELLLAVRANPVFSVLPLQGDRVSTVAFSTLQADWGQWLKRSDLVFNIPDGNQSCVVRLVPRTSVNEVHVSQEIRIEEEQIDWKCQIEIETTVLPVFRHRLRLDSEVAVTSVQVVAGEANRLESWHRRGDQLVIQLKEGTTGLHGITIEGRQTIRPDDSTLTLHCIQLQNTEIPETSMTVVDQDGLGLTFVRLGGAVPDEKNVKVNDLLQPGTPVRMVITNEEDPVVLQRIRPVDPVGVIAAIRSSDHVTFALNLSQWSGSLGPLHMKFSDQAKFFLEPIVFADGKRLPLVRESGEFVADRSVVKSLFDRPEFSVIWSMPVPEHPKGQDFVDFEWPEIFDGIQWSAGLLVPLDGTAGASEPGSSPGTLPGWLVSAGLNAGKELIPGKTDVVSLPLATALNNGRFRLPVRSDAEETIAAAGRDVFAVSDSIVWCSYGQSAVGETQMLLFAAKTPSRCSVQIPDGLVVTELQSDESTRWENAARKKVLVELNSPLTVVKMRWLSQRAESKTTTMMLRLSPPFPSDCTTRRTLTVVPEDGQFAQFSKSVPVVSPDSLIKVNSEDVQAGLIHAKSSESAAGSTLFEPLPDEETLTQRLSDCRETFLSGFQSAGMSSSSTVTSRSLDTDAVVVAIGRRMELSTVISTVASLVLLALAAFARNPAMPVSGRLPVSEVKSSIPPGQHSSTAGSDVIANSATLRGSGVKQASSIIQDVVITAPSSVNHPARDDGYSSHG